MKRLFSLWVLFLAAGLHWGCGSNNAAPSAPSAAAPTNSYPYSFSLGSSGTGNGQFSNPLGIAVHNGAIFVMDADNNRIEKFDLNGNFLMSFTASGALSGAKGLAFDKNGFLFVANYGPSKIIKMDQNGNVITTYSPPTGGPNGIAFDSAGNLYYTDIDDDLVQKCANDVTGCTSVGTTGTGDGQFNDPEGVFIDGGGSVWVADHGNDRVQKFSSSLVYQSKSTASGASHGALLGPECVLMDGDGNLIISESGNKRVQKLTTSWSYLQLIGTQGPGSNPGQFNTPRFMALDSNGHLYVADVSNENISVF